MNQGGVKCWRSSGGNLWIFNPEGIFLRSWLRNQPGGIFLQEGGVTFGRNRKSKLSSLSKDRKSQTDPLISQISLLILLRIGLEGP